MENKEIYHEKQRLQFCLLHALNNLLQGKDSFTRSDLDDIANKLDLIDPNKEGQSPLSLIWKSHHNSLTGNYDINVLISALEGRGKRVVWHDLRKGASSIDLSLSNISLIGVLLNVPVRKLGGLWRSRHWVALRMINGIWYNLDSDLKAPKPFENVDEVVTFLDAILSQGGQILTILEGNH
ncbi:hypothetical protein AMTRI_Chr08g202270 [Amborella trichopoda]|uniref:josephin-like protein n=1 Tax=Amborella trichopoda TaxID=13333 RepID=UPI0005D35BD2|nr:josephin-like protein [Amborella trichopoda]|eukprot:XP_011624730.1 josephin-like protein [Amborella trichopoda]